MGFGGLRVLALESRRAAEMEQLIRKQGGEPFVAPSMREVPLADNAERSLSPSACSRGGFDMVILLTGVGTRQLNRAAGHALSRGRVRRRRCARVTLVARGPKPVAALREMGLKPAIVAPEPNTWRELLAATEGRPERRIAVQEYGRPDPRTDRGAARAGRGSDAGPRLSVGSAGGCRALARSGAPPGGGRFDVALFTTAMQIDTCTRRARTGHRGCGARNLRKCQVCSIGPTTTEALEEFGVHP